MRVSSRITAKVEEAKLEEAKKPKPEPKKPKVKKSPKKPKPEPAAPKVEGDKSDDNKIVEGDKPNGQENLPDSTTEANNDVADKPVENGDTEKDPKTEQEGKKPEKKAVKKTIPPWASVDVSKLKKPLALPTAQSSVDIIQEAIRETANAKGVASSLAIKRYVKRKCPTWPKMTLKRSLLKSIEKGKVIQVTGKGNSGSFKNAPPGKAATTKGNNNKKGGKKPVNQSNNNELKPLEDLFPNIFTWVCEPKEASFQLIRKYIEKHHKKLDTEGKAFKKAIEHSVEKGQLDRITGKGSSGTFQLVDGAKKFGTRYEDAIEDAIIAMNEPKDASIPALRHYLSEYHLEYNVEKRPLKLKSALERCEAKGWIKRITGKGFSGTFRLAFPYHPDPRELWGEWYEEEDDDEDEPKPKRSKKSKKYESDEEEEESSEEESEVEEAEIIPIKKKRSAPSARKSAAAIPKIKKKVLVKKLATPKKKKGGRR